MSLVLCWFGRGLSVLRSSSFDPLHRSPDRLTLRLLLATIVLFSCLISGTAIFHTKCENGTNQNQPPQPGTALDPTYALSVLDHDEAAPVYVGAWKGLSSRVLENDICVEDAPTSLSYMFPNRCIVYAPWEGDTLFFLARLL
jgi:hypothetical protein